MMEMIEKLKNSLFDNCENSGNIENCLYRNGQLLNIQKVFRIHFRIFIVFLHFENISDRNKRNDIRAVCPDNTARSRD